MTNLSHILKQVFLGFILCLLVFGAPLSAYAQATDPPVVTQPDPTGISQPTGVSAATFHYNTATGLWENDYYTWDPVTKETLSKIAPVYTYNQSTGHWDTATWEYHPTVSQYELVSVSATTPPNGAITHGGPPPPTPIPASAPMLVPMVNPTPTAVADTAGSTGIVGNPATASMQPLVINTDASLAVAPGLVINTASNVTLASVINSDAHSGNAVLVGNTTAGNATSGDASAVATIMNLLQSSTALLGSGTALFMTDIQGDVTGNLLIDPAAMVQPASIAQQDLNKVNINSKQDGIIQNDIALSATSGNALVSDNRDTGNATTGTATAVANVLNLINSVVAANQSFLGVINIYGNFTGDILVPADTLSALLAGNTPVADGNDSQVSNLNSSSNQSITNNVDLAAVSGNATQSDNTHTGDATTGSALTKLTILNLTGHQINAANSLLVFVNVLGTWVGVIMDAPAGTTAAALADASATNSSSGSDASGPEYAPATAQLADNGNIINNITARATSGDATVSDNTRSGNATTGNATASANIFNLINSRFSLSHWFGVLFINVFGSWHGNFGAAKPPVQPPSSTSGSGNTAQSGVALPQIFSFTGAQKATGLRRVQSTSFGSNQEYDQFVDSISEVLGTNDVVKKVIQHHQKQPFTASQPRYRISVFPLVLGITGLTVVGTERVRAIRRKLSLHDVE